MVRILRFYAGPVATLALLACLAAAPAAAHPPTNTPAVPEPEGSGRSRLSVGDFKVFQADLPVTGLFEFQDPVTGESRRLEIRPHPEGGGRLAGYLLPDRTEILTLNPRRQGVGYEGLLHRLLAGCQQEAVAVSEFLPLGNQIILRLDVPPPETPCPFLEDPANVHLVVAPTDSPIPFRSKREIVSERTRSEMGLEGLRGTSASPILADSVRVEGGTELRFIGRVRGLDGEVWIQVEPALAPAPGVDPPRGFMKPEELRLAASITLERAENQAVGAGD